MPGKIEGRVKAQAGTDGLNQVLVKLLDNTGGLLAAKITANNAGRDGYFSFDGLADQAYVVLMDLPSFEAVGPAFGPAALAYDVIIAGGAPKTQDFIYKPIDRTDPVANDPVDLQFVKELLNACQNAVDVWYDDASDPRNVKKIRQRLRKIFNEGLKRRGEPALLNSDENDAAQVTSDTAQVASKVSATQVSAPAMALADHFLHRAPCTTCWNRYYTPGTIYYQNATYLNQCLYNPPCT